MKSSDAMFPLIGTRLQPGVIVFAATSRFNGLSVEEKPLKRFSRLTLVNTGLKPGVNEKAAPCAELKFQNGKQELNAPFNNKQTP
jgi:hypothetical protein